MGDVTIIYIYLLDEGVDVWRPVQATHEYENVYQIISPSPDPEDEQWEFSSGDLVRCETRADLSDGPHLVAYEKVATMPH